MNKREAVPARGGTHDVVLDTELAGILAHEAVGHTTEADMVLGGSVAADYMDKLVASPLVTMVDFAHTYEGETLPVPVYVDDEGIESEDTVLIEKGVLKSFMHNKESALHFDVSPTGNARAYQFFDEPLIRMRNTAILPGTDKVEDMIASIDDGYYLMWPTNGQADSTSEFMFGISLGYEIKNGKLGKAIIDTTISGVAFDMLKEITMVSDQMSWGCAGMCGKKQIIPVGMGGPAIKTRIHVGGL
jgi:TldD protein